MTQYDYEQKKRECWVQFCKDNGIEQEVNISIFDAFDQIFDRAYALGKQEKDAEGEEMLTVSRKKVQEMYAFNEHILFLDSTHKGARHLKAKLHELFGSKCLPDNVDTSEPNVDSSKPNVESLHGNVNSLEPKFKVGDYVRYKGDVHKVVATTKDNRCYLNKIAGSIPESDLEPYTKPTDHIADPGKMVDAIIKDGFSKERRLNIAMQIMGNIIKSGYYSLSERYQEKNIREIAKVSMQLADALIAECEKGDLHETD